MKPVMVGIGYVALGLIAVVLIEFMSGRGLQPEICTGTMSVMVLFASYYSYELGRKDGKKEPADSEDKEPVHP